MHKIKLILLLILPLSVLGQDLGIIDTKTTKNPAINGTHRISTDGKNLFFRNFFGLSKKVASTDSAVFTGTTVLPSNTTIGNVSATELGYLDGVTSPIQAQINSIGGNKVFYGTVDVTNAVSLTANIGDLYINTTSKAVYKKTNLSFPTGLTYIALASGTWVKLGNFSLTKNDVGLSDVDNTSDANKPISSATQTALNGKENTLTKGNITSTDLTITGGTNSIIGTGVTISLSSLGRIRHFSGAGDVTNAISLTANIGDIYFNTTNGTVYQKSNLSFPSGLTYITLASGTWVKLGDYTLDKSKVGLSNVDNTSDANKPISSATQTALDLKANITSPTFITDATTPRLKITGAGDIGKGSDLVMAGNSNDLTMHGTGKVILGTGGFQRLVVTNAGNVGVGTTAPVAKFEVSGLAGFRYNDGKQADGKYLRSNSTGVAAWDSVKVSEVFGLNTTYLPISNPTSTGTLTAPTIANSLGANFATTSGNVGVGTASPAYKLDVNGTFKTTSTTDLVVQGGSASIGASAGTNTVGLEIGTNRTGTGTSFIDLGGDATSLDYGIRIKRSGLVSSMEHSGTGEFLINSLNTGNILFATQNTERMRMFANGNVGIGTPTDEGYKLDVNGTARFSNNVSIGTVNNARTLTVATTTNDVNLESINSRTTGNNYALTGNSNGIGAGLNMGGFFQSSGATSNHGLRIYNVEATANNYSLYSDSPAQSYFQGSVGIGTASPNAPLQFANNTVNRKIVLYENTNNDHDFYGFGVNSGVLRYQTGIGTNHVFYVGATSTTSNELMRIQSNGNVGIGTTTPQKKLEVADVIRSSSNFAAFESIHAISGTSYRWTLNNDNNYLLQSSSDKFVANATTRLSLFDGGNIGIGTNTNAGYKLNVIGGVSNFGDNILLSGGAGTNNKIGFNADAANYYIQGISSGMQYSPYSVGNFTFTSGAGNWSFTNGNVGIGTTAPNAKLHVFSAAAFNRMQVENNGNFHNGLRLNRTGGDYATDWEIYTPSNSTALNFFNGSNRMTMFANGRVGIGTTVDAGYLLDVNGSARTVNDTYLSTTAANNVGIGTVNPYSKLQITRSGAIGSFLRFDTGGNSGYDFNIDASSNLRLTYMLTGGIYKELTTFKYTGEVGIGTPTPNASSILDITSTTKGVLFPRMTTTEISAISSPADGLTVYNTTLKAICFYDSSAAVWKRVSHSNM